MDSLPEEEILLNIFHRLPTKSLGMCMCVNKYWLSLIKNPNFIASNSKIRNINNQYLMFWRDETQCDCELFLDNDRLDFYKLFTLPFHEHNMYVGNLEPGVSVCNGLLCFIKWDDTVILWNPTNEKLLTLPKPTIILPFDEDEEVYYSQSVAFGFDSMTNDYKVIRFISQEDDIGAFTPDQVEIFSLNSNSWKIVSESTPAFKIKQLSIPILNGILNWIGYAGPENEWYSILGFDVNEEVFRIIDLPMVLREDGIYCKLATYKETYVAIGCHYSVNKVMEVWVMKVYGNVESWTRIWRYDVSPQLLPGMTIASRPSITGLLNNGEVLWEILTRMDPAVDVMQTIMSIDPESKSGEVWWEILTRIDPDVDVMHTVISIDPESKSGGDQRNRVIAVPDSYFKFGVDHRYFEESLVLLDNVNAISPFL